MNITRPTPEQIRAVCRQFSLEGEVIDIKPCDNGHINHTYIITCTARRYILQILNTDIFKHPAAVMQNIVRVTEHIRAGLAVAGEDAERGAIRVVPTIADPTIYYHIDSDGRFWRTYNFVEGTICRLTVDRPETFRGVGYAFGDFQRRLADFDASLLHESIPDFHNTPKRLSSLLDAVQADFAGRLISAKEETNTLLLRGSHCHQIIEALASGDIPLRVTHNDTKLSNILLDAVTGESVCIIDLDTVMPGAALYDFGDAIRSGASTAAEDERDLDKVHFDKEMFCAFAEGFIQGMGGALTDTEKSMLPVGAWTIIYEQAVRFLDDYLRGDTYYHVDYPEHNLVRARTQIKLLLELEEQMEALKAFVARL